MISCQRRGTYAGTAGEVFDTLGAETAGSKILGSASLGTSCPLATALLAVMAAGASFLGSGVRIAGGESLKGGFSVTARVEWDSRFKVLFT